MAQQQNRTLEGKTFLVTGGTTGIGLATVKALADAGAKVIATGRNPKTLEVAKAELAGHAELIASDAGDPKAIEDLFAEVSQKHGKLDGIFLNAGVARFAPLEALSKEDFDWTMHINVLGPMLAVRNSLSLLNEGASIVINTSVSNQKGMPNTAIYAASKAALDSFVRTAAVELAPKKVRVNAISPGPIETPIYGKLDMPKEQIEGFAQSIQSQVPLQRFGASDEVAKAARFLLSSESSYVTGTELTVDGGMTAL